MYIDIYLINGKEYGLLKEHNVDNNIFCYFVNLLDYNDIIIKKYNDKKDFINLTEEEFDNAIKYFNI